MTLLGPVARGAPKRWMIVVLLAAGLFASSPRSADGQGSRIVGEGVARPVAGSLNRMTSEPQRFHNPPGPVVDPKRRVGTATGMESSRLGVACVSPSVRAESYGCEMPNEIPGGELNSAGKGSVLHSVSR